MLFVHDQSVTDKRYHSFVQSLPIFVNDCSDSDDDIQFNIHFSSTVTIRSDRFFTGMSLICPKDSMMMIDGRMFLFAIITSSSIVSLTGTNRLPITLHLIFTSLHLEGYNRARQESNINRSISDRCCTSSV